MKKIYIILNVIAFVWMSGGGHLGTTNLVRNNN